MITRLPPSETENRLYFEKACDGVRVKICCGASDSGPLQATNHADFIHILDGWVPLKTSSLPHHAPYKWASTEFVSKFYGIVMPAKR